MAAKRRRILQQELRDALGRNEFELVYQPIVNVSTRATTCIEALVRWRTSRGIVSPNEFIPIAEETGLINPIGEWVLRTACREAANWPPHIKVGVNLSAVQFRKANQIDTVRKALSDFQLPAERLELEITELVLLQRNAENLETLNELKRLGVAIVLDDFGTGYSSLSYLRMFRFDKIKIDRSFVHELANNSDCASIVAAVAGLGRSLGIGTVAEGVETVEQFQLIRMAGCTHAQGYLFSMPMPASELNLRADVTLSAMVG